MTDTPTTLVVKLTAGAEALERANQALTVTATALASGFDVSLSGEATWFAVPDRLETHALPHAVPLAELLEPLLEAGAVTVCSQCAARRDLGVDDLRPGVVIRGSAAFVEEVMAPGTRTLVY